MNEAGKRVLHDRYCSPNESIEQLFHRASAAWSTDPVMAARVAGYLDKGWLTMSTPILSNAPQRLRYNPHWRGNMTESSNFIRSTQRGLPISCFVASMGDSREDIFRTITESGFASSLGGGLGIHLGDLRAAGTPTSRGSSSTGIVPFAQLEQSTVLAMSQGNTRRGSVAMWLPINHPEIHEFLSIRRAWW